MAPSAPKTRATGAATPREPVPGKVPGAAVADGVVLAATEVGETDDAVVVGDVVAGVVVGAVDPAVVVGAVVVVLVVVVVVVAGGAVTVTGMVVVPPTPSGNPLVSNSPRAMSHVPTASADAVSVATRLAVDPEVAPGQVHDSTGAGPAGHEMPDADTRVRSAVPTAPA